MSRTIRRPPGVTDSARRECDCTHLTHEHGTRNMYARHRCHCFACRVANAAAAATYKRGGSSVERHVNPAGTVRRLKALTAVGIGRREIAERLGVSERAVQLLRNTKAPIVRLETARRVAALYDELWDAQRTGRVATAARSHARAAGWSPPLAWDDIDDPTEKPSIGAHRPTGIDPVAVTEAIAGRRVPLTPAERKEAVRILTGAGHSATEIGERLGVDPRSIFRIRSSTGEAA